MSTEPSYSSRDRTIIDEMAAGLTALKDTRGRSLYKVWYDQNLSGGEVWWEQILSSIRRCDVFIFALSANSLNSYPCKLEFGYARDLKKTILPVSILDDFRVDHVPVHIQERQLEHFLDRSAAELDKLNTAPKNCPTGKPLPDPLPPA